MSELTVNELNADRTCKPIFSWPPVSRLVRWIGDKPVFETPHLDALEPDWFLQRDAARRYIENREPTIHKVVIDWPWPTTVGIVLVLVAVFGLLTAMARG